MFGENKDKLTSVGEKSVVGQGLTFEGAINSTGEIELAGSIKGPVNVKELVIKETGSLIGDVNAETVEVSGYLDGQISAQNVIISSTGEIKGNISFTEVLRTEDRANIDGHVKKVPLVKIESKTNLEASSKIKKIKNK